MEFHETIAGKKFYEKDFPKLVKALESLAKNLDFLIKEEFVDPKPKPKPRGRKLRGK